MRNFSRPRSRGFMLIDIIAALVLLTAFALIAAQLFHETMGVIYRAPAAQDDMTRFESVARTLREDAWGGLAFLDVGANAIQIVSANQANVRWEVDPSGDVYRTQGHDRRRWVGVGTAIELKIEGLCVVLHSTSSFADRAGDVRCMSVVQLAAAREGHQ